MKEHIKLRKIAAVLLILSLSIPIFSGCGSKTANASSDNNAAAQNPNSSNSSRQRPNSEERKKEMETGVKALVTDGTITQSQADKILAALTTQRQGNPPDKKPSGSQSGSNQTTKPSVSPSDGQKANPPSNDSKGGRSFSPLSSLVSDGTITQAQADAVMKKIGMGTSRPKNDQNSSGASGQTSNPTTTPKAQ